MTKKDDEKVTKTLNWRLTDLPTAGEVAELVDSEVITLEEAREILFKESSSSDEKVQALEEQVEFLQGLVKQLADRTGAFIPYTRTITTPTIYWANTNKVLNSSGFTLTTGNTSTGGGHTFSVSN